MLTLKNTLAYYSRNTQFFNAWSLGPYSQPLCLSLASLSSLV
jgi:hypothetical protein